MNIEELKAFADEADKRGDKEAAFAAFNKIEELTSQQTRQPTYAEDLAGSVDPSTVGQFGGSLSRGADAETSRTLGAARSFLNGMTFGFSDEIGLGGAALFAKASGASASIPEIYRDMKNQYNADMDKYARENPGEHVGMNIAGGLATGIAAVPAKAGAWIAAHPWKSGALLGGFAGFGNSPTMADAPIDTIKGTGIGLLTGGIARGIFGRSANNPQGPTPGLIGRAADVGRSAYAKVNPEYASSLSEQRAAEYIRNQIRSGNMTVQQVTDKLDELGPNATLADVNDTLLRNARGVSMFPGKPSEIAQGLAARSKGTNARLLADVQKAAGKGFNVLEESKSIEAARSAQARPLYDIADKQHVPENEVKMLYESLKAAADDAHGTQLGGVYNNFAKMLKSKSGEFKTNIAQLQIVKTSMRDKVGNMYRDGSRNSAKALNDKLLKLSNPDGSGVMERNSAEFAQANKIFGRDSSVLEAMDKGFSVLKEDAAVTASDLAKMSAAEKDAYISGAVKAVRDKILSGNKLSSDLVRERLKNAFPDEESFNQFANALNREQVFRETANKIRGGSDTVPKAMDVANVFSIGKSIVSGDVRGAAQAALGKIIQSQPSIPKNLQEPLARMLMTPEGSAKAIAMMRSRGVGEETIREVLAKAGGVARPQQQ